FSNPMVGLKRKLEPTQPQESATKMQKLDDDIISLGEVKIHKFDMRKINTEYDGKRVLIVGMSGSGKSTAALDVVRFNKHIPVWEVISTTEARNHTYGPHVHPACIHDTLTTATIERFKERQEQACMKWEIPGSKDPVK